LRSTVSHVTTTSTKNTASNDVAQENFKLPKTHPCEYCGNPIYHERFRSKGIKEYIIERLKRCEACHVKSCNDRDKRMTSIIRCNVTTCLTDTNVRKNSKDDDDVPISMMMSANEYTANQLALQRKTGLAKRDVLNFSTYHEAVRFTTKGQQSLFYGSHRLEWAAACVSAPSG